MDCSIGIKPTFSKNQIHDLIDEVNKNMDDGVCIKPLFRFVDVCGVKYKVNCIQNDDEEKDYGMDPVYAGIGAARRLLQLGHKKTADNILDEVQAHIENEKHDFKQVNASVFNSLLKIKAENGFPIAGIDPGGGRYVAGHKVRISYEFN